MRFFKVFGCMAIITLALVYVATCFVQLELNPLYWPRGTRLSCVLDYFGISLVNIILSLLVTQTALKNTEEKH